MAGRPGRDRLTSAAANRRPVAPDRRLLGAVHLAVAILLVVATVVLFGTPAGNVDCCGAVGLLGVVTLGELLLLLGAAFVAALAERFGPLVIVDTLIAAPLAALVAIADSPETGRIALVAWGLLLGGLLGAVLAAIEVRRHRIERIVLAVALIALLVALSAVALMLVVPIVVLVVVAWPSESIGAPAAGSATRARVGLDPRRAAPGRREAARARRPDAAAILGPAPDDPPDDEPR